MPRRRQQGVALIIAMLVAALATMLAASMAFDIHLDLRRAESLLVNTHARQYALGAESWAALILDEDFRDQSIEQDSFDENWAIPIAGLEIEGGMLGGQVEDLQGRFNLNNLIDTTGTIDQDAVEQFGRLLEALDLDPRLSTLVADWIDADQDPAFPDGAEDLTYTVMDRPYRTADHYITNTSELMAVQGIDLEIYAILRPHVSALPVGTSINLNTATAPVLESIDSNIDVDKIIEFQCDNGFSSVTEAEDVLGLQLNGVSVSSSYFGAQIQVAIGTYQLNLYSLLARDPGGETQSMLRRYGVQGAYAEQPCNQT